MPAWSDRNLRSLAAHIHSPLYLAHVRATTGTPVQETNCHPFRHENWLFVHNGAIDRFLEIRRDLVLAIDPAFFNVDGGLDRLRGDVLPRADVRPRWRNRSTALERMAGFVEATARQHGIEHPLQMTLGVSDGERLFAVRYSSLGSRARCSSRPTRGRCARCTPSTNWWTDIGDEDRAVVSEPLGDLPGVWEAIPEATALIIQDGPDEQRAFQSARARLSRTH